MRATELSTLESLVAQVRKVNPEKISLPVLQELVREIQTKSPDEVRAKSQYWTDKHWKQWREHTSHNPW